MDLADSDWISESEHREIFRRCDTRRDDVLLTKDGANTGNAAINCIDEEFSLLSSVAVIRCQSKLLHNSYLLQYLLSANGQQRLKDMMSGNAITRLTLEKIKGFTIPVPPLADQLGIAAVLDTIDAAIAKTAAVIAKLKMMRAGLLHDLLTRGLDANGELRDPLRHPELFQDSPLGRIPTEWDHPKLSALCSYIGSGVTPRGGEDVYVSAGILFIRSQNVTFEGLKLEDVAFIPDRIHLSMIRSQVFAHDVLFNITGASIGRYAAFDLGFLVRLGFSSCGPVYDTMMLAQLVTAGTKQSAKLADCCERWLGRPLDKTEQNSDWSGSLTEEQLRYATLDAAVLRPLASKLLDEITAANLTRAAEIEQRCLPAMVWLGDRGVSFDQDAWIMLAKTAATDAERYLGELQAAAPAKPDTGMFAADWNWDSPAQIQDALALAGCPVANTRDETLAGLDHPLAALVRQYREANKRSTAYGAKWLEHIHADGRIYPKWRQLGAASGRMSCSDPGMQQFPRGEYRRCVAAPPGRVLVKADYSQIELRIAAKVTGDQALLDAYQRREDLHTLTAKRVLGVESVTKDHRQLAKALNFGLLYGMGAKGLRIYAKTNFSVALSEDEAQRYRRAFFAAYPGLAAWHQWVGRTGKQATETRTLSGRRLLGVSQFNEKLNAPVQGTGADGLKLALAILWERWDQAPGAFPVLAVHDEIVVEAPEADAERVTAWLKQAMLDAMNPLVNPVPVEVEAKVGRTWGG